MAKDRNGSLPDKPGVPDSPGERDRSHRSKHRKDESDLSRSSDEAERSRSKRKHSRRRSRRRDGSYSSENSESESESLGSESDGSGSSEEEDESSESKDERRRRRRKEKRRREREREYEKERRRRKEKKRRRREKAEGDERKKKKKKRKGEEEKKKKEKGKMGAVTNSWGKCGIIRETDMWNKRPEFTAWLAEVKQVNLEHLSNWEEKQMFKEFMEDHNTATFPSKKFYDLDAYHQHKMAKEMKKGSKKVLQTERTVFNDEEQRRQELLIERERHKEEKVEALKCAMQSGMAQAMREQAQLREEMAYQYRLGNFEAAAAIQKRLDPDAAL